VTEIAEVPSPVARPGHLVIQTRRSLISAGSERIIVEFGKASLIAKARSQPEKVKQVLEKIKTDGLLPTLEAVFSKLDEPMPLGYCNAGVVLAVGRGYTTLRPGPRGQQRLARGDRLRPRNLCARIPDGVTDDQAAFTVLTSIGLQGIRLLQPTLGERFIRLRAGPDRHSQRPAPAGPRLRGDGRGHRCRGALALAARFGAQVVNPAAGGDVVAAAGAWTNGRGVDGVLVTASAQTDEIMHDSAQACRKRAAASCWWAWWA